MREVAPLLATKIQRQTKMLETYCVSMPICNESRVARPPRPIFCEFITVIYDMVAREAWDIVNQRTWDLFRAGMPSQATKDNEDDNEYADQKGSHMPVKYFTLTFAHEYSAEGPCGKWPVVLACIEWRSPEARTMFLQGDDVRRILHGHAKGSDHEASDDETLGNAKEYEQDYEEHLMAYDAIYCRRVLGFISRTEAAQRVKQQMLPTCTIV